MRPFHLLAAGLLLSAALPHGTAHASPPSGGFTYTDLARGRALAAGTVHQPAGTETVLGAYTLVSGGDTGWRNLPGTTVLVVAGGALTVQRGAGCLTEEYPAGSAAVLPGGRYRIVNEGTEPAAFSGTLMNLRPRAKNPWIDGPTASAPKNCGAAAYRAAGANGLTVTDPVRGRAVPSPGHGAHGGAHAEHGEGHGQGAGRAPDSFAVEEGTEPVTLLVVFFNARPVGAGPAVPHHPTAIGGTMSRRSTVGIATACTLVGAALIVGQSGAAADTTGTLTIRETVTSFATHDLGKKLGVGAADCMRASGTSDTKGLLNCVETFRLPGGDVVASGLYDLAAKKNSWGIVGGTGRYRGATGQIDFVTVNESTFVDTFRFER